MDTTYLHIPSRFLRKPVDAIVANPNHAAEQKRSCLLFFHGAGESPRTLLENVPLEKWTEAWNARIVFPDLGNSFGLDAGEGKQYHAFLTEELLPCLLDTLFDGHCTCAPFCVGGISMGAYIALSLGLERQEYFNGIISISGAFDMSKAARFSRVCGLNTPSLLTRIEKQPGEQVYSALKRNAGQNMPPLYFACGYGDLFYDTNRTTADRARELGYSVRQEDNSGLHNWDYWRKALPSALHWAAENTKELSTIRRTGHTCQPEKTH